MMGILVIAAMLALAGCGGGGDSKNALITGSGSGNGGGTNQPVDSGSLTVKITASKWAAFFDGAVWTSLCQSGSPCSVSTTKAISNSGGRYGIAYVCDGESSVNVEYSTIAETTGDVTDGWCDSGAPAQTGTVSGSYFTSESGARALIGFWNSSCFDNSAAETSPYTLPFYCPAGSYNMIAVQASSSGIPSRGIISSGINISTGANTIPVDFTGQSAFAFVPTAITITGKYANESIGSTYMEYMDNANTYLQFDQLGNVTSLTMPRIPAAKMPAGWKYAISTHAFVTESDISRERSYYASTSDPGDNVTIPLGDVASFNTPVFSLASASPAVYRATWSPYTGGRKYTFVASTHSLDVTSGYLGSATSITFPDLSTLPGWTATWAMKPPSPSAPVNWSASVTAYSDTSIVKSASISGSLTNIAVNLAPSITAIAASPTSGTAPLAVSFTSTCSDSDGTCASYSWTFGDGSTSTSQNPSHTYSSAGTYTATLTVTDDDGATDQNSVSVTVTSSGGSGTSALIPFVSTRDGFSSIYTMNADGSNVTKLVQGSATVFAGFPILVGSKIAFEIVGSSSGSGNYVINTDGTGRSMLADLDDYYVESRYDGANLLVYSTSNRMLNSFNITTQSVTNLLATAFASSPGFRDYAVAVLNSSYFVAATGGTLSLINRTSSAISAIPNTNGTIVNIDVTPSGKIIYQDDYEADGVIYTINADGTGKTALATNAATPKVLSDGRIAYQYYDNAARQCDIYIMNADGSGKTNLTNTPNADETLGEEFIKMNLGTLSVSSCY